LPASPALPSLQLLAAGECFLLEGPLPFCRHRAMSAFSPDFCYFPLTVKTGFLFSGSKAPHLFISLSVHLLPPPFNPILRFSFSFSFVFRYVFPATSRECPLLPKLSSPCPGVIGVLFLPLIFSFPLMRCNALPGLPQAYFLSQIVPFGRAISLGVSKPLLFGFPWSPASLSSSPYLVLDLPCSTAPQAHAFPSSTSNPWLSTLTRDSFCPTSTIME